MHPRGCPHLRPATTPLNWAGPWYDLFRERHPKFPGLVAPVAISLIVILLCPPSRYAVLGLAVDIQWPPCEVLPALWTVDPSPLPLLVTPPLSRNPTFVGLSGLDLNRPAWLANHTHSFLYVCPQAHPVREPHQLVKRCLYPHRIGGGYHPVVRVKKRCLHLQPCMSPFHPNSPVVPFPNCPSRHSLSYLVVLADTPPLLPLLPVTPSDGPLRSPQY